MSNGMYKILIMYKKKQQQKRIPNANSICNWLYMIDKLEYTAWLATMWKDFVLQQLLQHIADAT